MSNSKPHILQLIEQLHDDANKECLIRAPEKSFFRLPTVKYRVHEFCFNTFKPVQPKSAAIHKKPSPTTKIALMRYIGWMSCYSMFMDKLLFNLKPLFDLLHDNSYFSGRLNWKHRFNKLKLLLQKMLFWHYWIPTIYSFFRRIFINWYMLFLFRRNDQEKRGNILYLPRTFTTNEQNICTTYGELVGIVLSLTIYQHDNIGSDHSIIVLKDRKPIPSCFTTKINLFPKFNTSENQLTDFQMFCIIYTKRRNLFIADILGRSFIQEKMQLNKQKINKFRGKFLLQNWHMITKSKPYTVWSNMKLYFLHRGTLVILFWLPSEMINSPFVLMTKEETSQVNHYVHIPLKILNHIKVNKKNQSRKKAKKWQQSALLNDINITDSEILMERIPQNNDIFILSPLTYHCLVIHPPLKK